MPQVKRLFIFLVFCGLFLGSCSGDDTGAEGQGKSESLPKVDKNDFREVNRNGFTLQLYKKMSLNTPDPSEIMHASYLTDEYHLSIRKVPKTRFKNDPDYPKTEQLKWFTETSVQELRQKLISFEQGTLEKVTYEKRTSYKLEVSGRTFGFPLDKQFFLRFFELDESFVVIEGWTVHKNAAAFRPIVQYMGMTLLETP